MSPRQIGRAARKQFLSPLWSRLQIAQTAWSAPEPASERLRRAVEPAARSPAEALELLHRTMGVPLVSPSEISSLREIATRYPKIREALLHRAEEAVRGEYNLLGGKLRRAGACPDWHQDFKSGYRWDWSTHFRRISIVPGTGADIKVPWELSRLQHLPAVAYAYALTEEDRYSVFFVEQATDWIHKNPYPYGVNWACTMDVAMRATSLSWAYSLLQRSPAVTSAFRLLFLSSVLDHGRHIFANLENQGVVIANHYLADLSGLLFLSQTFPAFRAARDWRSFAARELQTEMSRQVDDDGGDFEASTSYHRLATELLVLPALLLRKNGYEFAPEFWSRLRKMFILDASIQKRSGRVPQFGDNDSGRGYCLVARSDLDHGYLNTVGAAIFGEPKLKFAAEVDAEAAFVVGPAAFRQIEDRQGAPPQSRAFGAAGIYVLRSDSVEVFIRCGTNGQDGNGGHAHNDNLSFELAVDGQDVVVDPGTGLYTPDPKVRNFFRSTGVHSALLIDGEEQAPLFDTHLFYLAGRTRARSLKFEPNDDGGVFAGELEGMPVRWRRTLRLERRTLTISDELDKPASLELTLPLPPGAQGYVDGATAILRFKALTVRIESRRSGELIPWSIVGQKYSPGYGRIEDAIALKLATLARDLETTILSET